MANTTGWVAGRGQGISYGSAGFTAANFNSLAAGSVVVASSAITNGTALDLYAEVSFAITATSSTGAGSFFTLYILPLNQDNSTYGDGTANGTTAPSSGYTAATIGVPASVTALTGTFPRVVMPPGSFKFAIVNNCTVAMASSAAATVSYRTTNENLNA